MRKLILFSLALVGCGHQKIAVPKVVEYPGATVESTEVVEVRKLTDEQKISLLRAEAKKRGLKWRIWCTTVYEGDEEQFDGWAVRKSDPFEVYAESGGKSSWWVICRPSQADAAFALYQAIQGEPDEPLHRKSEAERKLKMCPPELRGN